jgi:hypothetical protein
MHRLLRCLLFFLIFSSTSFILSAPDPPSPKPASPKPPEGDDLDSAYGPLVEKGTTEVVPAVCLPGACDGDGDGDGGDGDGDGGGGDGGCNSCPCS